MSCRIRRFTYVVNGTRSRYLAIERSSERRNVESADGPPLQPMLLKEMGAVWCAKTAHNLPSSWLSHCTYRQGHDADERLQDAGRRIIVFLATFMARSTRTTSWSNATGGRHASGVTPVFKSSLSS
jgi:hypothetical protein